MDVVKNDVIKKKTGSILSAIVMIIIFVAMIGVMIYAQIDSGDEIPIGVLTVIIVPLAVCVLGVVIALFQRLKEINGGEEDEADKY